MGRRAGQRQSKLLGQHPDESPPVRVTALAVRVVSAVDGGCAHAGIQRRSEKRLFAAGQPINGIEPVGRTDQLERQRRLDVGQDELGAVLAPSRSRRLGPRSVSERYQARLLGTWRSRYRSFIRRHHCTMPAASWGMSLRQTTSARPAYQRNVCAVRGTMNTASAGVDSATQLQISRQLSRSATLSSAGGIGRSQRRAPRRPGANWPRPSRSPARRRRSAGGGTGDRQSARSPSARRRAARRCPSCGTSSTARSRRRWPGCTWSTRPPGIP